MKTKPRRNTYIVKDAQGNVSFRGTQAGMRQFVQ